MPVEVSSVGVVFFEFSACVGSTGVFKSEEPRRGKVDVDVYIVLGVVCLALYRDKKADIITPDFFIDPAHTVEVF